jgi:translation elongation factor EF-Ts
MMTDMKKIQFKNSKKDKPTDIIDKIVNGDLSMKRTLKELLESFTTRKEAVKK